MFSLTRGLNVYFLKSQGRRVFPNVCVFITYMYLDNWNIVNFVVIYSFHVIFFSKLLPVSLYVQLANMEYYQFNFYSHSVVFNAEPSASSYFFFPSCPYIFVWKVILVQLIENLG